jgi:hypothetical protein
MLKLHERGFLVLPARRRPSPKRRRFDAPELFDFPGDSPAIEGPLNACLPLTITALARRDPQMYAFSRLLARHHYLGYQGPVGENIAYRVQDRSSRDVACVLFGAAAWKVAPRDRWIGGFPSFAHSALAGSPTTVDFSSCPGSKFHIWPVTFLAESPDALVKIGRPSTLIRSFCLKRLWNGIGLRAPATKPPIGFAWDKPRGAAGRIVIGSYTHRSKTSTFIP